MSRIEPNGAEDVAALDRLIPAPQYISAVWQEFAGRKTGGDKVESARHAGESPLSPHTWIVWGSHDGEDTPRPVVYTFPTATDCLLWYRWCVLGIAEDIERSGEYDKELFLLADDMRAVIDAAPEGAAAAALLRDMEEDVPYPYDGFELHWWESIHDFLSREGGIAVWRQRLGDTSVVQEASDWQLSVEGWRQLSDWLRQEYS